MEEGVPMQRPITIPTAITVSLSALLSMVMGAVKGYAINPYLPPFTILEPLW
jgi:hypothetical protein